MGLSLPQYVAVYFESGNAGDYPALRSCFTDDAQVSDEHHTHTGPVAIEAWARDARTRYQFRSDPQRVSNDGDLVSVEARVTGNFPGSPISLTYDFRLEQERIKALRIH